MWNPFKKNSDSDGDDDKQKMGMMQSLAMKKLAKMSPEEQKKLAADMMKPENKGKLLQAMEMMKKMGMATDEQLEEAKKKMGL